MARYLDCLLGEWDHRADFHRPDIQLEPDFEEDHYSISQIAIWDLPGGFGYRNFRENLNHAAGTSFFRGFQRHGFCGHPAIILALILKVLDGRLTSMPASTLQEPKNPNLQIRGPDGPEILGHRPSA